MFRKYVRFLLTNICSCSILKIQTEQLFGINVRLIGVLLHRGINNMTVQEREKRVMMIKNKQIAKRRIFLVFAALFVATLGSIVFGSIFSKAKNPTADIPQYKYYKSITIEQGDSLWSIAEEYCTDAYEDTREYVSELKQLNSLTSETIHAGQHLLVVYFDTEIH